jgi:H+/Cl- antiporter ClcA
MPAALIIGAICGVLGSLFIYINTKLGIFRKYYIVSPLKKIAEAVFFGLLTSSVFYLVTYSRKHDCVAKPPSYLDRTF